MNKLDTYKKQGIKMNERARDKVDKFSNVQGGDASIGPVESRGKELAKKLEDLRGQETAARNAHENLRSSMYSKYSYEDLNKAENFTDYDNYKQSISSGEKTIQQEDFSPLINSKTNVVKINEEQRSVEKQLDANNKMLSSRKKTEKK